MRTYGQFCALAKALDVIGDRWSLLIVRELLIRGASRYTDIRHGLPGVATNLLAERLRELEQAGVVRREAAPPPVATTLFSLTPRGKELLGVMRAIAKWGVPLLADASDDDVFRSHWLAAPATYLRDSAPDDPPIQIEVRVGDEPPVTMTTVDGHVRVRMGAADAPDAVIAGTPRVVVGMLLGRMSLADAQQQGLRFEGNPAALSRLQPSALQRA